MKILFIHQSFPGQYRHILRALASADTHQLIGLGISPLSEDLPDGVTYLRYPLSRGNTPNIHEWLLDIDSKLIRGEACAQAAFQLRSQGFQPDLICAHPGWGEALFLRDIWPNVPILCYQEFFYNSRGFDYDFDPEFQGIPSWHASARLRLKNANPLLMLEASDWNVTPTLFQKTTFPREWHHKISVIHDGIDTQLCHPNSHPSPFSLKDGTSLTKDDQIITFVNRNIEPYRGCHTFIRSIPAIQRRHPNAHIVIVGSETGVSYGRQSHSGSWKDLFLQDISSLYNPSLVHFTGTLPYHQYIHLLQLSSCHVYLTYPFVLSWSLLEAMSCSLPVIGSDTEPVREVIKHGETGYLVDFFSPSELADAVSILLDNPDTSLELGQQAREFILNNFSLQSCVPRQLDLIEQVASRSL